MKSSERPPQPAANALAAAVVTTIKRKVRMREYCPCERLPSIFKEEPFEAADATPDTHRARHPGPACARFASLSPRRTLRALIAIR
ncbi:MAG TPA: hypothetical protein VK841_17150, partial [Polyangiaceae bacterium]|nr:hypothetical protein [Polyangiaceae bacterium]